MIKAFKRWLYNAVKEGHDNHTQSIASTNKLHDMLSHNMAAMVAFKIDNGYIVRTMNPELAYHGERSPGFAYCADHQAIADYLVASAMRERIGVQPEQPRKNVKMVIHPQSNTAGLVGQQATPSY
jgi:hypothetical protein